MIKSINSFHEGENTTYLFICKNVKIEIPEVTTSQNFRLISHNSISSRKDKNRRNHKKPLDLERSKNRSSKKIQRISHFSINQKGTQE